MHFKKSGGYDEGSISMLVLVLIQLEGVSSEKPNFESCSQLIIYPSKIFRISSQLKGCSNDWHGR